MSLVVTPKNCDTSVKKAIQQIARKLGPQGVPTFASVTLTDLTASALIGTNASKLLESVTIGTGLDYTRPTISLSHLGIEALTDPGADRIMFWDNTASACKWLIPNTLISITGTNLNVDNDLHNYSWTNVDATDLKVGSVTQAWDAQLDDIAALAVTNSNFIVGDGTNWVAESGATARTSIGLGTGDTPTFSGLISTGVVQATDFAKTGWPTTTGATFSFDNASKVFRVTDGGSAYYYIDGVKYTLGGDKTVDLDDIGIAEGLWYIYFDGVTLTASQTIWSFLAEDKALVAILYWDNTNNKEIFLGWEAHTFHMSGATHARLHYAGGARWEIGLLVSDAGSEHVDVSAGDIWDEDLNIPITDDDTPTALFEQILSPARLPIYYRDGASAWRKYETGDKAAVTDVGYLSGGNLKWNDATTTWSNETVGLNNYVAYYVVATNEQTEPIALIMGQRVDNKLTEAKANNVFAGLSLAGLPFEEMVVLARLILKDTGTYTLEEVLDLRAYNVKGNITSPLITQHAGLGGLNWASAGHYFDAAVDFNAQNISNIGTVGCGVITQSGTTLANTYQPVHANLTSLATLTYAAASFVKMTGVDTFVLRTLQETSDDLEATIDHDNLLNFTANEHYLQSAITEVGTIATGVWEGTSIAVGYTDAKCVAVWPDTYTADQNLLEASSPTFVGLTLSGTLAVEGASVTVGEASTTTGTIMLHDSGSANTITLTVPDSLAASLTFTLPPTDGDNLDVLQTNGSGVLTWVAPAGGGGAFTSYCKVGMTNNQVIGSGSYTKLNLDDVEYDNGSEWDTTNKRFVADAAGYYHVCFQVVGASGGMGATTLLVAKLYKNGAPVNSSCYGNTMGGTGQSRAVCGFNDVYLNGSTDYIEIFVVHDFGSNKTFNAFGDNSQNYICVHRFA